jgi:hypothetical protein
MFSKKFVPQEWKGAIADLFGPAVHGHFRAASI